MIKLSSGMTDSAYIQAFRDSNQLVIHRFYEREKRSFIHNIVFKSPLIDNFYAEDIYHESILRLQQNILAGRLTEENIQVPLSTYLLGIGFNVAFETMRDVKGTIHGESFWNEMHSFAESKIAHNEINYGLRMLWMMDVETPLEQWLRSNPKATIEQQNAEYNRLLDNYNSKYGSHKTNCTSEVFIPSPLDDILLLEREKVIRSVVMDMGMPCAPLLLGAIWHNIPSTELASTCGYANTNSMKTQKSRCLNKLKEKIKAKLKSFGYEYK